MAEDILTTYKQKIESLTLVPSGGGKFEVSVDGNLVYSKVSEGRFPEADELKSLVSAGA